MRMLMNNLDPEVGEKPSELVVYGGIGRAARDWESFDRIVATLKRLEGDETLLVQSGKPVGVFRTHADAPRVLIANSNLVPHWANWEHFNLLDRKGLMMYGQMTAGSWIYIGTQGIVQGTYETFVEIGRQHFGGNLRGKWFLTADLAAWAARSRSPRSWPARAAGYRMPALADRDAAEHQISRPSGEHAGRSAGDDRAGPRRRKGGIRGAARKRGGNFTEMVRRGVRPDAVTDQTWAHDPVNGYLPAGWTTCEWERAGKGPEGVEHAAANRWPNMSGRCSIFTGWGFPWSTTATTFGRWRWKKA